MKERKVVVIIGAVIGRRMEWRILNFVEIKSVLEIGDNFKVEPFDGRLVRDELKVAGGNPHFKKRLQSSAIINVSFLKIPILVSYNVVCGR